MASDLLRISLRVDPGEHPLLAKWLEDNRWVWQEPARDLLEQALREGRLPAVVPVKWPTRAKTRQGGAAPPRAARKVRGPSRAGEEQFAGEQVPQAPSRPAAPAAVPAETVPMPAPASVHVPSAASSEQQPDRGLVGPSAPAEAPIADHRAVTLELEPEAPVAPAPTATAAPLAHSESESEPAPVSTPVPAPAPTSTPAPMSEEELMRQRTKSLLLQNNF